MFAGVDVIGFWRAPAQRYDRVQIDQLEGAVMKGSLAWYGCVVAAIVTSAGQVVALPKVVYCSTEIVNGDCTLNFDRNYPVTLPTIQMRQGARVTVNVLNPLPFESLSLDPQSVQANQGTDQVAGFLSAVLPNLKAVGAPSVSGLPPESRVVARGDSAQVMTVKNDLSKLDAFLDAVFKPLNALTDHATTVYAQLQEALSAIPRPETAGKLILRPPSLNGTPNPWTEYKDWRAWLLCELAAQSCAAVPPPITNMLSVIATLQLSLTAQQPTPAVPPAPPAPATYPIFDGTAFDKLAAQTATDIAALPAALQATYTAMLLSDADQKNQLVAALPSYAGAVSAVAKDFQSYFVNILQTNGAFNRAQPQTLGQIHDPRDDSPANTMATRLLGCQATFAINAVNEIGVPVTSVPTAAQKTALVTITVLYADPHFEISTGAWFSWLPDRSFANQTIVTQGSGSTPVPALGEVVITQSLIRPTVIPFVAANIRLGHDFLMPGKRRGAIYVTAAIGFNAYNTTAEYAVGPSLSWRSMMISGLLHFGHDVRLTQGEAPGEAWCNSSGPIGSLPMCNASPPSPSTETFWNHAVAVGVSVRVPSLFGGGSSSGASAPSSASGSTPD